MKGNKNTHTKISDAMNQIKKLKPHIMRTVNQDKFRLDTFKKLAGDQCLLIMDWAIKILPLKYKEKQTYSF